MINQTYSNWELIIVDDGSNDNSKNIIKEYIDKDSRISSIKKNNSGVSDTRNIGLKNAKGDYIVFLDADDIWHNDNLEKKITFLASSNFDTVYSYCHR